MLQTLQYFFNSICLVSNLSPSHAAAFRIFGTSLRRSKIRNALLLHLLVITTVPKNLRRI